MDCLFLQKLLDDVRIVPERNNETYKQNLITQILKRPYWCISRQRVWGVPIPVFYRGSETIINTNTINRLCELLEKHGSDFWWTLPTSELLPTEDSIEKGTDIFDIWFDSGISWSYVLGNRTADLYLEGIDQFNGWFQSSLMTSVALNDRAPYKKIFVHGFAVDEKGLKMSKSVGNVVDPERQKETLGVDVLRWWVACHASTGSTAFVSPNVLQSSQDEVQKIRNTLRFAVASLDDYVDDVKTLKTIDKYLLHLCYEFDKQSFGFYDEYQYNKLCMSVVNFVTNPVSALYYSVVKDRLYCNSVGDSERRGAQYVLRVVLETICKTIAPIVPHLVEEVYMYRTDAKMGTFFKTETIRVCDDWNQPKIKESVETALDIKKYLNKQHSNTTDLKTELTVSDDIYRSLQVFDDSELLDVLQVAEIVVKNDDRLESGVFNVNVTKTSNTLCDRCKKYNSVNVETLCTRCNNVMNKTTR